MYSLLHPVAPKSRLFILTLITIATRLPNRALVGMYFSQMKFTLLSYFQLLDLNSTHQHTRTALHRRSTQHH